MKIKILISLLTVVLGVCLFSGCESSGGGGDSSGSYAGVWTGKVCGRNMTMTIVQNGKALSGSYTLSDPTFTENMSGSVSSEKPEASASLKGGGGRHFEIVFKSYKSFSGGFYNGDTQTCVANASK